MDMLQCRRPHMALSPNWCVLCKKEEESLNHLFLYCDYSRAIWNYFLANLNCSWVMPRELLNMFASWCVGGLGERGKCLWGYLCHAVIWNIWKERNLRIF